MTRTLPRIRRLAIAAMVGLFGALRALAQDAPLDLHADPTPVPAKTAKHKPGKDEPKPSLSEADVVARANAFLDSARVMTADFVQVSPNGRRSEGKLYVERPGKMLFQYAPPAHIEIVADGRSVSVRDSKLGTQDLYFIGQTPLKFLLNDHIDLAKDTRILSVQSDDQAASIELEDKATFGGTSHLTLVFDPLTFELKQWTVIDPQRLETVVTLFNVDLTTKPDPSLFYIDEYVAAPKR